MGIYAVLSLLFCLQVKLFEFCVWQRQEITKFVRHASPLNVWVSATYGELLWLEQ
jgi:hypothetical protein